METSFTAVLFGLLSAAFWGAGDFVGGMASKRLRAFQVVLTSQIFGMLLLILAAIGFQQPIPPIEDWLLGMFSGLIGGLAILTLYASLASGQMGVAAPLSGVVAAAIPVVVGALLQGLPKSNQIIGFGVGLVAVWLVSRPETGNLQWRDILLPLLAGLGFGAFLVLINRATTVSTIYPLVGARIGSIAMLTIIALLSRQPPIVPLHSWRIVALAGILDSGGNAFFTLAASIGRLDVAGVLSSLYPASTVFLAWLILRENLNRGQLIGVGLTLLAIVLISI
ncbi:MAG: DMT family transporter [Anaerolineae bacterium]